MFGTGIFQRKSRHRFVTDIRLFVRWRNEYSVEVLCSFSQPYLSLTTLHVDVINGWPLIEPKAPLLTHGCLGALYKYDCDIFCVSNPNFCLCVRTLAYDGSGAIWN